MMDLTKCNSTEEMCKVIENNIKTYRKGFNTIAEEVKEVGAYIQPERKKNMFIRMFSWFKKKLS